MGGLNKRNQLKAITGFLFILMITQVISCKFWQTECEQYCENPNRNEIFRNFPIEKQFEYYRTCACWDDSISNKGFHIETLSKREDINEFLINILKTEDNSDVLIDALELLSWTTDTTYNVNTKDVKGRKDLSELVKKAVGKIPEKDERDLIGKLFGGKAESRKDRLEKLVIEIKEHVNANDAEKITQGK